MQLNQYFKSIIDQDNCAIVICDLNHKIIYLNPQAEINNPQSVEAIKKVVAWFAKDKSNNRVHTFFNEKQKKDGYMIALRDEDGTLIGYYEKHEYRTVDETPFYAF